MPILKELKLTWNSHLTGNIRSLRVLKETLEKVCIESCKNVRGNFMDLADFPRLLSLELIDMEQVSGDICDIGESDFLAIKDLELSADGGTCTEFDRVSDALDIISTLYPIMKQRPVLLKHWFGMLSGDSPDWYEGGYECDTAPLCIRFLQAGSRVGYHWYAIVDDVPCEAIWLDPEPDKEGSDYEKYVNELQKIEGQVDVYKGFQQPPNEDEYQRIRAQRIRSRFLMDAHHMH